MSLEGHEVTPLFLSGNGARGSARTGLFRGTAARSRFRRPGARSSGSERKMRFSAGRNPLVNFFAPTVIPN